MGRDQPANKPDWLAAALQAETIQHSGYL